MFKKIMIVALVIMTLLTALIPASLAEGYTYKPYSTPVTKYVYTENGGALNVRSIPAAKDKTIIGKLEFGTAVTVLGTYTGSSQWVAIRFKSGSSNVAWVMQKFLTASKPTDAQKDQAAINRQLNSYKPVKESFLISARPSNPDTGWVNFRTQPGASADRITGLKYGQTLTVIGETTDWYKAIDSVTGRTGFVSKSFVVKLLK